MKRLLWVLTAVVVSAQTPQSGGVQGKVLDEQGLPVVSAKVKLRNALLHLEHDHPVDASGTYRVLGLAPSSAYEVTVEASGFAVARRSGIGVISGEVADAPVVLRLAQATDAITVSSAVDELESTEIQTKVSAQQLQALPTNGRLTNRFALLDAHVRNTSGLGGDASSNTRLSFNGNIFRDTQYRLDGNTNYDSLFNNAPLQRVSLSSVSEFRVLTSQFDAEQGSTSTGLVLTTTRSGTDQFHGEGFFYARPSGLQARPPLASVRIPNQLAQGGFALGGPLRREKTHFFANYERLNQDRGSLVTSPAQRFFVGEYRDNLAMVKLDHRFNEDHAVSLRTNAQRETNTNTNDRVGGLIQPSAATRSLGNTVSTQLTDTLVLRDSLVNELRAGYINAVPSSSIPLEPQLIITRPGISTDGAATFSQIRMEVYQMADQLSWQVGRHSIKMGGDFIRRKVRDFSYDQFGTYTIINGVPTQYAQRFGVNRIRYGQTQWAGFVQDNWRVSSRLTLNYGLRYDYQSILTDYNNFGPRFGLAYDLRGDGNTIVRAGGGLYYDQPFFHGLTQRFLQFGVDAPTVSVTLTPSSPLFPTFPQSYGIERPAGLTLAPRTVTIPERTLLSPYTTQFTATIDQRLPRGWKLSVTGIRNFGVKQFIHYERNAPAPFVRTSPGQMRSVAEADRTRPLFNPAMGVAMFQGVAIRELRQAANGGVGYYNALDVRLNKAFTRRYQAGVHYVYSSNINTVTNDHLGAQPQEWSDVVRGERALSDFAQRHRFVANGIMRLKWGWQASAFAVLAGGLPVNAITGVDNNGDTGLVDRPFGFGRNAFRGLPQRSMDLSVAKVQALSEGVSLEFRADGFNVFNNRNFHAFNNVYGNGALPLATFLRPLGGVANADPGRQFTFGVKLLF
jgi:outer membrane receptor protein involved in Fe transport